MLFRSAVDTGEFDSQGNKIFRVYEVPGSGIFTFHPADPQPIVIPKFSDPEINALRAEADRQRTFGRDVSQVEARADRLQAEREPVFNATVLVPYVQSLRLGNVTLISERGRIIIPPAGIRGREVTLIARQLDFQGGEIFGLINRPGPPPAITGTPSFSEIGRAHV